MIHVSLRESMKSWSTKHPTATVLLQMPHFPQVTIRLLGRYVSHSKQVKTFHKIPPNKNTCSSSHGQYFPIIKLQSGGCGNCRGVLADFGYPWESKIWKKELISLKVVSDFTTFAHDWLE